jgi:hypothetical protein
MQEYLLGTNPFVSDSVEAGVPDGQTRSGWLSHPLFGDSNNIPNVLITLEAPLDGQGGIPNATLIIDGDLRIPLGARTNSWAVYFDETTVHTIGVTNFFGLNVKLRVTRHNAPQSRGGEGGGGENRSGGGGGPQRGIMPWDSPFVVHDPAGYGSSGGHSGSGEMTAHFLSLKLEPFEWFYSTHCYYNPDCVCTNHYYIESMKFHYGLDPTCGQCGGSYSWTADEGAAYWGADERLSSTNFVPDPYLSSQRDARN